MRVGVSGDRDAALAERAKKMEADLAELEDEGAKSDLRRKVPDDEICAITSTAPALSGTTQTPLPS